MKKEQGTCVKCKRWVHKEDNKSKKDNEVQHKRCADNYK